MVPASHDVHRSRAFPAARRLHAQVATLFGFVRSAPLAAGAEILIPGEPEGAPHASARRRVPVDDETWRQIKECATEVGRSMLEVVTMKEIDAIFAVTDTLGTASSLVIPLDPPRPGAVRRLPSGKIEITVEAARPIDEWLTELPRLIAAAQEMS